MTSAHPHVELLWWSGCPSWEEAGRIVREEMAAAGLDPEALEAREVGTDEAARREGFVGSPTIRVDGHDVQEPGDRPLGLTCRVYRLRDGRVSPLPDRADVREALGEAGSRRHAQQATGANPGRAAQVTGANRGRTAQVAEANRGTQAAGESRGGTALRTPTEEA
jgi:hypothetical protein